MRLPEFKFIQPHSLQEACSILGEHHEKAAILAGGTSLMVNLGYRLCKPSVVIGLKGLAGLDYVNRGEGGGLVIGSMTALQAVEHSPLVLRESPVLAEAIGLVGVPSIRRQATLGGNLCLDSRCIYYNQSEFWRSAQDPCFKLGGGICHAVEKGRHCQAVYQGDLGPVLMALGAEVKIVSARGEKTIPLEGFFTGRGEKPNILEAGEILAEIRIPAHQGGVGAAYEKLRPREGMDFPMAGVAVAVGKSSDGVIEQARIVLGAVGSSPIDVSEGAALLAGCKPADDLFHRVSQEAVGRARPVGNLAMDAAYRKKMVGVVAERALRRALAASATMDVKR